MKRRNIAVCVTGYNWEYESKVVDAICRRCKELSINVLTFASTVRKPECNSNRVLPKNIILGETEIFNLINYDITDGIIIFGDSIIEAKVIEILHERAKEKGIPLLNINDQEHITDINVNLSDKTAMEFVVRHLVEDHGLRKINFIGGFPGNLQTEERLAAYKKVLEENDIPIEEKRIAYGEFWKKAMECTAEFVNSGDMPEAIVCASDTMAIFCMDYLKERGYRIPQDVIVTGFDGINDCNFYDPTITTVRRSFEESGVVAVDTLVDIWSGKDVGSVIEVPSKLVCQQSCGCEKRLETNRSDFLNSYYGELNLFKEFDTHMLEMNTRFTTAKNSAELYDSTRRIAEFFKLKKMYICICAAFEKQSEQCVLIDTNGIYEGISENVVSMVQFGHKVPVGTEFLSSELLPEDFLNGEESVFYAFSPIYFKDRFIGYVAYEPSKIKGSGDLFAMWLMTISNNAGSFYLKCELERVVEKLNKLYIRDPLTGLYNRRGMSSLSKPFIEQALCNGKWVSVICADIDNLKPINDVYGHAEGDNAIKCVADVLYASVPEDSICTRTGGDEFCVIVAHDNRDDIEAYIQNIEERLRDYNNESSLPYKVDCSCGYSSVCAADFTSEEELIKLSDENMYAVKLKRKTERNRVV